MSYDFVGYCTGHDMTGSFIVVLVACYQVIKARKRFSFALGMVKIAKMNECTHSAQKPCHKCDLGNKNDSVTDKKITTDNI